MTTTRLRKMKRTQVVQACLDRTQARIYLEIGVFFGLSFGPVRANRKLAVDPVLRMPRFARRFYRSNAAETSYHEQTSDAFFAGHQDWLGKNGLSVVFVDGLHTYEQSLRDVESSLRYLHDDGTVVVHDCNPTSRSMAYPSETYLGFWLHNWRHLAWCGDVWKTIVHLRSTRPDLEVAVLDCDFGVGLIRRGRPRDLLPFTPEEVKAMPYERLAADRRRLLNLKPPEFLFEFVQHGS
jgi:hypothetical protein